MRDIDLIVVHCSATPPSWDIGADDIREWHTKQGWSDIGYHDVIRRDGDIESGRPVEKPGAHAKGYNDSSIAICLIGGVDEKHKPDANFTFEQYKTLRAKLDIYRYKYPNALIKGHRDLKGTTKSCPCFDVEEFIK